jgi:hypothetical protein
MALPLPRPSAVVHLTRYVIGTAVESAAALATVPVRVFRVLGAVELLVTRMTLAVDRVETLLDRTDHAVDQADEAMRQVRVITAAAALVVEEATQVAAGAATVVGNAGLVAESASGVIERAAIAAVRADEMLVAYEPTLRRAEPMARRFVEQLSHEEVTAAIRLVDELPKLKDHLTDNVLPILGTLDRVGPDVHDLLEVTRDLKLALAGIPGLKMLRRRGEDRLAEEEDTAG